MHNPVTKNIVDTKHYAKKKHNRHIPYNIHTQKLKKTTTKLLFFWKRQTNIPQQLSKPACVRGKYRQGRIKYILIKQNIYIKDYEFAGF